MSAFDRAHLFFSLFCCCAAGKCTGTVNTGGENINICWSPNGQHIAVGDKVRGKEKGSSVSILSCCSPMVARMTRSALSTQGPIRFSTRKNTAWKSMRLRGTRPTTFSLSRLARARSTFTIIRPWSTSTRCEVIPPTATASKPTRPVDSLQPARLMPPSRSGISRPSTVYVASPSSRKQSQRENTRGKWLMVSIYLFSWPVRTLSFSYDGQFISSASEDNFIDIVSEA